MIEVKGNNPIKEANNTIREKWSINQRDPYRPRYHPIAPHGWMNDPNGLIYLDGWYHVFYQWNPYGPTWGTIHWGHMKTKDFQTWEHIDTAIAIEHEYEKDGCFSGSAVVENGMLYLIYTSNQFLEGDHPYNDGLLAKQYQCIAWSHDGVHFTKDTNNPLIKEAPSQNNLCDFRDPKVWFEDDQWNMILGYRDTDAGEVILYQSKDLKNWNYVKSILKSDSELGYMWECPDMLRVEGKRVLMFSPMGSKRYKGENVSGYILENDKNFIIENFKRLDYGPHFYAPQSFSNLKKSVILGWVPTPFQNPENHNWSGCLSLPRELRLLNNNTVESRVFDAWRVSKSNVFSYKQNDIASCESIAYSGDSFELIVRGSENLCSILQIKFKGSSDLNSYGMLKVDFNQQMIVFDTSHSDYKNQEKPSNCKTLWKNEENVELPSNELRLYIDKSVVEVYGFGGVCVLTHTLLSNPDHQQIQVTSNNGFADIDEVLLNEIAPCNHNLILED